MAPHHDDSTYPEGSGGPQTSDLAGRIRNPRRDQGEQLRAELVRLRSTQGGEEHRPGHPFRHVHASALHEAGHAVFAVVLGRQLVTLTVLRDTEGDGFVRRELRESSLQEIVEEIFIAYSGYEAAMLYGFPTDPSYDEQRVDELKAKCPHLVPFSQEEAKTCVIQTLKAFRRAVEYLAVALFTHGEMTGDAAASLVMANLPRGEESLKRLKRDIERLARKKTVLVLGWGSDGCDDVDEIVSFYGHDQSLSCVKAPCADSRDVLQELEDWLKDNPDAKIIYLGAHGTPTVLRPYEEDNGAQIAYSELAKRIAGGFSGNAGLTVFLGACQSEHAAGVWKELDALPIHLLVAFSGMEDAEVVRDALGIFLQQGDLLLPGESAVKKPISFLEQDLQNLQKRFPSISIHHKMDRAAQLSKISEDGAEELRHELERRGRVGAGSPLMEAALDALESEVENDSPDAAATHEVRSRVKTRTIGPRPPRQTRPRRKK